MTASHRRHVAALAASLMAVGALSACGSGSSQPAASSSGPTPATAQCHLRQPCTAGPVTAGDTTVTLATAASPSAQTLSVALIPGGALHCAALPSPSGAALADFSSSSADVPKTLTYSVGGVPGQHLIAAYHAHSDYLGCYGSPHSFTGNTGSRVEVAPFVSADGLYEAALLPCSSAGPTPCFTFHISGTTAVVTIKAPAGDPKTVG